MPPVEIRAPAISDPVLKSVLDQLDRELRAKLGREYVRLVLFGSRARGDHQADSDADVAIVLRGEIGNRWRVKQQVIEITYPILVDTGTLYPTLAHRTGGTRGPGQIVKPEFD